MREFMYTVYVNDAAFDLWQTLCCLEMSHSPVLRGYFVYKLMAANSSQGAA